MPKETILLIGTSESDPNLYYRTRFFVPDPCIYIEHKGEKILVLSDLELDRGREEATVDTALSLSEIYHALRKQKRPMGFDSVIDYIFKQRRIKKAVVPGTFHVKYADKLREMGYDIVVRDSDPFFAERIRKTPEEVGFIRRSQRDTEKAMRRAIDMLKESVVRGKRLYLDGKVLTSERIKGEINSMLAGLGYTASHTIVASGVQGSMPHHSGSGPIMANSPVVIDIFPRSQVTGYYGDMTRTVVVGEPSDEAVRMYKAVLKGQKLGLSLVKAGVKVREVHEAILEVFSAEGFETGVVAGRQQGFIHSTGHGLGLEIHEPPRIAAIDAVLEEGMVVTVEPGLYYERIGGVRIEDVVVVKQNGCENLNGFPKKFRV